MATSSQPSKRIMSKVSTIVASDYRIKVVKALLDGPKTPSQITDYVDADQMAHYSRAVSGMKDEDITELLVPEDKHKGRIYGLTEEGKEAAEFAVEM